MVDGEEPTLLVKTATRVVEAVEVAVAGSCTVPAPVVGCFKPAVRTDSAVTRVLTVPAEPT